MVSTGILRYDKRVEPGNLINCPNLKNKRQQYSCNGCLIVNSIGSFRWQCRGLRTARSSRQDHESGLSVMLVVNLHRWFIVEPVMN